MKISNGDKLFDFLFWRYCFISEIQKWLDDNNADAITTGRHLIAEYIVLSEQNYVFLTLKYL